MKKITLSKEEIEDLKDLYQSEIDRAQRRIDSLKSILKKIEKGDLGDETEVPTPKKRGRKPKVAKPIESTAPKKGGVLKRLLQRMLKRPRQKNLKKR